MHAEIISFSPLRQVDGRRHDRSQLFQWLTEGFCRGFGIVSSWQPARRRYHSGEDVRVRLRHGLPGDWCRMNAAAQISRGEQSSGEVVGAARLNEYRAGIVS